MPNTAILAAYTTPASDGRNRGRALAQGFLDYPPNGFTADPATLKTIYDSSLPVLYRLPFALYAEARELLPLRESQPYRDEYSLSALAREVAARKESGRLLLPTGSRLWARLRDLFEIINTGSPPLKVATLNGGLYDSRLHPFLTRSSVGDARLAVAIDLLTRVDGALIDDRDLAEEADETLDAEPPAEEEKKRRRKKTDTDAPA